MSLTASRSPVPREHRLINAQPEHFQLFWIKCYSQIWNHYYDNGGKFQCRESTQMYNYMFDQACTRNIWTALQFAWNAEENVIVQLVWVFWASKPISWMEQSQDSPNSQITTLPDIKWHFAWDLKGSEFGRSPEIPSKWALIWIISYASLTNGSKAVQKLRACISHDCGFGPYMLCLHRERFWKTEVRADTFFFPSEC